MADVAKFVFSKKKVKGFTLVELLIVISIIGILSALMVMNFSSARIKARDNKRISDLNLISSALSQYYSANLRTYPLKDAAGDGTTYLSYKTDENWLAAKLASYISPLPSDSDSKYTYHYVVRDDGRKAAIIIDALESGTAKCNIPTQTMYPAMIGGSQPESTLPDAVRGYFGTSGAPSSACYYVAL